MISMEAKKCNGCGLPDKEYGTYKNRKGETRDRTTCRDCMRVRINARRKEYRKRDYVIEKETAARKKKYWKNPEKHRQAAIEYRKQHPEKSRDWRRRNKDRINEVRRNKHKKDPFVNRLAAKKWYDKNQKKAIGYQQKFYKKNKESLKPILSERGKKYRAANPERCKKNKKEYYYSHQEEIIEKEAQRYRKNKTIPEKVKKIKESGRKSRERLRTNPDRYAKHKAVQKQYNDKYRGGLEDGYIIDRLQYAGINKKDITPELIEIKRLELSIRREIKNDK